MGKQPYEPTRFMLSGSHYDKEKADRAVMFIESLKHTKGEFYNKPFLLLDWQETIVRDLFGVVKEDGTRQFKQAVVFCPKKEANPNSPPRLRCIFSAPIMNSGRKSTARRRTGRWQAWFLT